MKSSYLKKGLLIALIFNAISLNVVSASEVVADSIISAVTVFPDRAKVSRSANVVLQKGSNKVVFRKLPVSIDNNSLRVEGKGSGRIVIGTVQSRKIASRELVKDEENRLQKELTELNDKRRIIEAEIQALSVRQSFVENLARQATGNVDNEIKRGDLKPETWENAWKHIERGVGDAIRGKIAKEIERRGIDEQIRKTNADLNQIRTGSRDEIEVTVEVEALQKSNMQIVLNYQLPNVYWTPIYDARLDTESGLLELILYGNINQKTGEDWQNVDLTLSTARPASGANMPNLNSWWIDILRPEAKVKRSYERSRGIAGFAASPQAMMSDMEMNSLREEAEYLSPSAPAEVRVAEVVSSEFASEYRVVGKSTVVADNSSHKFAISRDKIEANISVRTTPKLSNLAYLFADFIYSGEAPLLSGNVSLFRDNAFIGNTYIPMIRPLESAKFSFGIDDKVIVKRTTLSDERGQQGLITKEQTIAHKFKTTIENLHSKKTKIMLFDNIPVAKDKSIKVEVSKKETTEGYLENFENNTGILVWAFDYNPKEKKEINLSYSVTYPQDSQIGGL